MHGHTNVKLNVCLIYFNICCLCTALLLQDMLAVPLAKHYVIFDTNMVELKGDRVGCEWCSYAYHCRMIQTVSMSECYSCCWLSDVLLRLKRLSGLKWWKNKVSGRNCTLFQICVSTILLWNTKPHLLPCSKYSISFVKTSWLILFREIKLVCESRIKYLNTPCVCEMQGFHMFRQWYVQKQLFFKGLKGVNKNNYTLSRVLPLIFAAMRASDLSCISESCLSFKIWN
jgi:hypothetical protein